MKVLLMVLAITSNVLPGLKTMGCRSATLADAFHRVSELNAIAGNSKRANKYRNSQIELKLSFVPAFGLMINLLNTYTLKKVSLPIMD